MSLRKARSDEVFLNSLDRALNIVGDAGKHVIYEALENRYQLKREDLPKKPEYLDKALNLYLGSAAEAVMKETLLWIKEASGIEADDLKEAIAELRAADEAALKQAASEESVMPHAGWKLEAQTPVSEIEPDDSTYSYKYSGKFSFGPKAIQRHDDEDSREALEAYLKSIVEKHAKSKAKFQDI